MYSNNFVQGILLTLAFDEREREREREKEKGNERKSER